MPLTNCFTHYREDYMRAHFPQLDGLRAVAVCLVLLHHFGGPLAAFFDQGYYAVDLFFVISGFLITSILVAEQSGFSSAYYTFVGRRSLRIFPVYYVAIAAMYVMGIGTTHRDIGYLATYTWNYASDRWQGSEIFYLWSLSVEEQFYLFWPVLVLLLRRRLTLLLCATVLIITIGYAQLIFNLFPQLTPYNYTGLINRMGSLGFGAFGAVAMTRFRIPERVCESAALEFGMLLVLVWTQVTQNQLRLPLMGLCSLFLVIKAVRSSFCIWGVKAFLEHRVTQHIGRVSYGIYVYHLPLAFIISVYLFDPIWLQIPFDRFGLLSKLRWNAWIIKLPLFSLLTIGLASVSYRFMERPILALKERWFPVGKLPAG